MRTTDIFFSLRSSPGLAVTALLPQQRSLT
jgi:hypothetical protein